MKLFTMKNEILLNCFGFEKHKINSYQDLDKECTFMNIVGKIILRYSNSFSINFFGNVIKTNKDINSNLYCGYYCPSPTCDILVGGLKRGKISSRGKIYTHEHGFDSNNRLIYTKSFLTKDTDESITYYIYFDNVVLQITFNKDNELIEMAISRYELNKIVSCCKACVNTYAKNMINTFDFAECYMYKNNVLYKQKSYSYLLVKNQRSNKENEFDIDVTDEVFEKNFNKFFDGNDLADYKNLDRSKFFDITFFMYDSNGYVIKYKTFDIKNNEVFSAEDYEVLKSKIRKLN